MSPFHHHFLAALGVHVALLGLLRAWLGLVLAPLALPLAITGAIDPSASIPVATPSAVVSGAVAAGTPSSIASWDTARDYSVRTSPTGQRYVADELLVGLERDADRAASIASLAPRRARLLGEVGSARVLRVQLAQGEDPIAVAPLYASIAGVRYAEPNFVGEGGFLGATNDTHFAEQWHLRNTGQIVNPGMSVGTPGADVAALGAWSLLANPAPVVLAIIDSGMDFTHPEFLGRTVPGWDFVSEDADATADNPHGIWCAGVAAANADNAFQVAGLDPNCTILPLRIINAVGNATVADFLQALDYCAANEVDVVSMSLINFGNGQALADALANAHDAGCILVACAGNGGIGDADVSMPGASPFTISIGATTNFDARAGISSTGAALDFVAPGRGIITVGIAHTDVVSNFTGCSAATPIAAAIVSMLKSQDPSLTQERAYELLKAGAEDEVGPGNDDVPGRDDSYGWGRLNAWRSLASLAACPEPVSYGDGKKTSIGTEPVVRVHGTPRESWEQIAIEIEHAIPGQLSVVFHGPAAQSLPWNGGTLLVRPPLIRLPAHVLDAAGHASSPIAIGSSLVGKKRYYQAWFRDPWQSDGTGLGITNAVAVEFCR